MNATEQRSASPDLTDVGAGFASEARGSQEVFRQVLSALSHPGVPVDVSGNAEWPTVPGAACHPASAAVLLALLDAETTLWLSPSLARSAAEHWLRFHTGCTVVTQPQQAQFVWAASLAELPDLNDLWVGTDVSPEMSVTCVVDVPALAAEADAAEWALSGPGIRTQAYLGLPGTPPADICRFEALRSASHAMFPCGVDVLLATTNRLVGLPRTTRLTAIPTHTQQEA